MRKFIGLSIIVVALLVFVTPTFAKGPNGPAGKSNTGHLYLSEKNPKDWEEIIDDGAWGKLNYQDSKFVFNGHKLNPMEEYTLINFAREGSEWPATVLCFGNGVTDEYGNINIKDAWDVSLFDYDTTPTTGDSDGYKIWLVPSADVNCKDGLLSGWHSAEILFEDVPLIFND